jgi:nucleotide-binding universal stress UspA family protein
MIKHLLVHVDSTGGVHERLELSTGLARRFGARLTGLFAESDSLGASIVGRRSPQQLHEAAERARDVFTRATREADVDAEWWHLGAAGPGELVQLTAACCRYADLAIFGQLDPKESRVPAELVDRVLFECGRPVLVVPASGHHQGVGKRVVVGWNASREAARAVNDAIPLMRDAEVVSVVALQRPSTAARDLPMPPADIVQHLALHGVTATYERVVEEEAGIGAANQLFNRAFERQADLMVIGASPHAFPIHHARDTAELLRSSAIPVLVAC